MTSVPCGLTTDGTWICWREGWPTVTRGDFVAVSGACAMDSMGLVRCVPDVDEIVGGPFVEFAAADDAGCGRTADSIECFNSTDLVEVPADVP